MPKPQSCFVIILSANGTTHCTNSSLSQAQTPFVNACAIFIRKGPPGSVLNWRHLCKAGPTPATDTNQGRYLQSHLHIRTLWNWSASMCSPITTANNRAAKVPQLINHRLLLHENSFVNVSPSAYMKYEHLAMRWRYSSANVNPRGNLWHMLKGFPCIQHI